MVPVFQVSLRKYPVCSKNSQYWWFAMALVIFAQTSHVVFAWGGVEFPGPVDRPLLAAPLSAVSVPWSGGNSEYLLVGDESGHLNLVYHLFQDVHFGVLFRYYLGGEVLWMGHWEGGPYGERGVVAATANPDRLHFIEISYSNPFIRVDQTVVLPEDPGMVDFVSPGPGGEAQLALSLPGVDLVLVLRHLAGLWTINQTLNTGDEPLSLVAIDMDDDQVLEFITADRGELSGTLGIFTLQPDGSYALQGHSKLPGRVHHILAEDFDLDGLQELVVSYSDLSRLDIMTGDTGDWVTNHSLATSFPADYFRIVSLPEGDISIVTCVEDRGLIDFFTLVGETWDHQESYYVGCRPQSLVAGDLNGDDVNEVVCLGYSENLLTILLGNTLPGFWGYPAVPLPANSGSAILADFDGDGLSDLVVATMVPTALSLYLREPDGGLSRTPTSQEIGYFPVSLAAGDFLGDQTNELAALDFSTGNLELMTLDVDEGFVTHSVIPFPSSYSKIQVADVDNDGQNDIYLAQPSRQQVDVLFGLGEGAFTPVLSIDLPIGALDVVAIGLNQDSFLDLVVTDGLSRVWSLLNLDGRSFGTPVPTQANSGARHLAVEDLDGDSDLDLVVGNPTSETITILENLGDGTLDRRIGSLSVGGQITSLQCEDMNSDGIADIVVHLTGDSRLLVIEAQDTWGYFFPIEFQTSSNVLHALVEDFNQDGQPDVLNLDNDLLLGLIMFNTQRVLVSVDPTALTLVCSKNEFMIHILPDRQGPWQLSLGSPGHWQVLAANGQSRVGVIDYDGRGWILKFDPADIDYLDESMQLRLTVGSADQEESLALAIGLHCLGGGDSLPGMRWRDLPWPNPFNPRVHGRIQLDAAAEVDAAVFDLAGRRVATLLQGNLPAGVHALTWDGRRQGQAAAAGLYLLRIRSENSLLSRKIILLK